MIRRLQKTDIDAVSGIWLDANRDAHDFIPAEYWESNFRPVKEMLLQAEVYVYIDECKNEIEGFVGWIRNILRASLSERKYGQKESAKHFWILLRRRSRS